MSALLISAAMRRCVIALAMPLLHLCSPAYAVPIDAATLRQPAMTAAWASRAMILSVARAGTTLVAVGERGFVIISADNGRTWHQAVAVPTSATLTHVGFADASTGWAVGHMGVVMRTSDGGSTWSIETDGVKTARLALDRARALAANEYIANAESLVADGADKPLFALLVESPDRVLALGAFGTGLRIDAARRHAVFDDIPNPGLLHVYGLAQRDGRIYAAGEQGLLLRSEQGGRFKPLATPYKGTLFGTLALADGVVLAFGLRGTVLRSADYGNTWATVESGTRLAITSALELDDGKVLLGSQSGQILMSADAGLHFGTHALAPQPVASLAQAADGTLIVAGPRGMTRLAQSPTAEAK